MRRLSLIDDFRNWREHRKAMAELHRLDRKNGPYQKAQVAALVNAVKSAASCNDPTAAMQAFNELQARAPDVAISSATALRCLLEVGALDLAESAIEKGLRKYPGAFDLMLLHADVANRRQNWPEASRRWGAMRKMYSGYLWARFCHAVALKELGEFDEADKLLEQAVAMEPLSAVFAMRYAEVAEQRGDLEEALRRWEIMRARIEGHAAWTESARIMCLLNRQDEAVELLTKARWRFESRPEPLIELARLCHRRGLLADAVGHWQAVRELFPQNEHGYIEGARALRDLGQRAEAEAVLQSYADRAKSGL